MSSSLTTKTLAPTTCSLTHSPYSVLFGHQPKIGLLTTALSSSIFDVIKTEEELQDQLGLPAVNLNAIDQGEINDDIEEEELINDNDHIIDDQDDSHLDSDGKSGTSPFDNRIQRTDLVPVPNVDRGPTDGRNILAVIMEIKHDKYKLGIQNGVLLGYCSYHQISIASGLPTLFVNNIIIDEQKSLREIVRIQNVASGQGVFKCDCKGGFCDR
ncbi:unnamed protein product [Rotaria sp. Silwood1]|nr:unnamed protein product [Rotaria sp. Silwood1]